MRHKYAAFIRFLNFTFDVFALNVALVLMLQKVNQSHYILSLFYKKPIFLLWVNTNLCWVFAAFFAEVYTLRNFVYFKEGIKNSFKGFFLFILLLLTVDFLSTSRLIIDKNAFFRFLIYFSILFWIARFLFYFLKKKYNIEMYNKKGILLIGAKSESENLKEIFEKNKEYGYYCEEYLDDSLFDIDKLSELVFEKISNKNIDEVFFVKTKTSNENLYNLIHEIDKRLIRVRIIPDFFMFYTKPQNLSFISNVPVLSIREEPLETLLNRMFKRGFDVFFSLLVITLIFSWLFPILAILIKLESKGPIFFKQLRSGRDNREFWCYKFRSMKVNTDSDKIQATKNDSRITKIGSFMRKTSIDELPQFLNVLLGNMSVVGPRPHMLKHTQQYSAIVGKYMIRHFVKPGITGWAQVKGYRGEVKNVEDIEKRIEHDIWYIENWSFWLDLQVILLTLYNIIKGEENAH